MGISRQYGIVMSHLPAGTFRRRSSKNFSRKAAWAEPMSSAIPSQEGPPRRPVKTTWDFSRSRRASADCSRSRLRRLGFGLPHQARPRRGNANIPCGLCLQPSKPKLSTLLETGTFCFVPAQPGPGPLINFHECDCLSGRFLPRP